MDLRRYDRRLRHGPPPLIALRPGRDVALEADGTIALSGEPWMVVVGIDLAKLAGRFVAITYAASRWDAPARPLFRFIRDGVMVDRIAPAAILGRGIWIGRIPAGTQEVHVSPTGCSGRFDFAIEAIRSRRTLSLLAAGLRWNARSARSALLTRLIGWAAESDVNLAWAIGARPLSTYATWRAGRTRPLDLAGLDRPRIDWATANPIRMLIVANGDEEGLARSLSALTAQVFPRWTVRVVGAPGPFDDPRILGCTVETALLGHDGPQAIAGHLRVGAVLEPEALAIVAERAARDPAATLFYGDALHRDPDGTLRPCLMPGWSPRLQAQCPYIGMAFVKTAGWTPDVRLAWIETGMLPATVTDGLQADEVVPLRRILLETPTPLAPTRSTAAPIAPAQDAKAAIVIPTRDNPRLLQRIVASIRARSPHGHYQIVIVDNGSVDPEAIALLASLNPDPDVVVVPHPGPFNFSLMCNRGAAASRHEVLIFLNDDTEVLSEDWLDRLVAHAMQPAIGAVGARLTYPDGRLQHVGVLVGMGESAGHFGAPAPGDDPGWMGCNAVAHEVSAVTGACLAVARTKFDAVGGFDAIHLPIELSDIDLCLKLNEKGWQTIVDPAVHLMHEESFSRGGATFRRLDVYESQRATFVTRWRHVLRDDPAFHPGLSLYSSHAALS